MQIRQVRCLKIPAGKEFVGPPEPAHLACARELLSTPRTSANLFWRRPSSNTSADDRLALCGINPTLPIDTTRIQGQEHPSSRYGKFAARGRQPNRNQGRREAGEAFAAANAAYNDGDSGSDKSSRASDCRQVRGRNGHESVSQCAEQKQSYQAAASARHRPRGQALACI